MVNLIINVSSLQINAHKTQQHDDVSELEVLIMLEHILSGTLCNATLGRSQATTLSTMPCRAKLPFHTTAANLSHTEVTAQINYLDHSRFSVFAVQHSWFTCMTEHEQFKKVKHKVLRLVQGWLTC